MSETVVAFNRIPERVETRERSEGRAANGSDPLAALRQRRDRLLATYDPHCEVARARVLRRLSGAMSPAAIWVLTSWLNDGPSRASEGGVRLRALQRLMESEQSALRCAAHQWLAELHTIDLRCEIHAKRQLKVCLSKEVGLQRRRIQQLLRQC